MRNVSRKIAYLLVLVAMVLLMGEKIVPHHHCVELHAGCCTGVESIHFGYGDCEECAGEGSGHSHGEERCCDDTQLYLRVPGADVHFEKKYISFNNGFILPEQIVLSVEDSHVPYICLWHLKIPDVWVPYTGLRAPPVA